MASRQASDLARRQASTLSAELRTLGAEVIEIPFIEIRPPRSYQPLDTALKKISDYDWLILASVNGNEDLLVKIVALFLKRYPALLADLRSAQDQGDGAGLARAAHTLRGSGGNFMTKSAMQVLAELEGMGRQNNFDEVHTRLAELDREMAWIERELTDLTTVSVV